MEILFEAESRDLDPVDLADEREAYASQTEGMPHVGAYARSIVIGVAERLDIVDDAIAEYLRGWTLPRLAAVDRAILRVGAWELLYADVPPITAVDEAVSLATLLSTDEAPAFVNGVLDLLRKDAPDRRLALQVIDASSAAARSEDDSDVFDDGDTRADAADPFDDATETPSEPREIAAEDLPPQAKRIDAPESSTPET